MLLSLSHFKCNSLLGGCVCSKHLFAFLENAARVPTICLFIAVKKSQGMVKHDAFSNTLNLLYSTPEFESSQCIHRPPKNGFLAWEGPTHELGPLIFISSYQKRGAANPAQDLAQRSAHIFIDHWQRLFEAVHLGIGDLRQFLSLSMAMQRHHRDLLLPLGLLASKY